MQGLSLVEVVVNFELDSQKSLNEGQMYVPLSRITSTNELYLIGKSNRAALKVNVSAKKEHERLRTESPSYSNSQPQMDITESQFHCNV